MPRLECEAYGGQRSGAKWNPACLMRPAGLLSPLGAHKSDQSRQVKHELSRPKAGAQEEFASVIRPKMSSIGKGAGAEGLDHFAHRSSPELHILKNSPALVGHAGPPEVWLHRSCATGQMASEKPR